MAVLNQTPLGKREDSGCLPFLIIAIALVFGVGVAVKTCRGPQSQARRLLKRDPCGAAALFAQDVRRDWKGSMTSLNELLQIQQPCVLGHLIDLMDLSDGRDTNGSFRQLIWEDVQRRTASMQSPKPPYDPYGSQKT